MPVNALLAIFPSKVLFPRPRMLTVPAPPTEIPKPFAVIVELDTRMVAVAPGAAKPRTPLPAIPDPTAAQLSRSSWATPGNGVAEAKNCSLLLVEVTLQATIL